MDIVANFLGHDLHTVHGDFYRLPNEVLQVAKVSKILLSMEQGGEGLSQGDTLDSVPVLNEELGDDYEADVLSDAEEAMSESHSPCLDAESLVAPVRGTKRKHPPKTRKWKQWSPGEKAAVQRHFHQLILTNTLPGISGKSQIEQCLKEEPILHERTWRNIKDYIRNSFRQNKACR
ncbi:uncharacterized protein [Diadema antillarum]|uniref:uncharacterized protein n=1 Tax=Diadema antillarum TaxID=105358 RepID=UPI003A8C12AB